MKNQEENLKINSIQIEVRTKTFKQKDKFLKMYKLNKINISNISLILE